MGVVKIETFELYLLLTIIGTMFVNLIAVPILFYRMFRAINQITMYCTKGLKLYAGLYILSNFVIYSGLIRIYQDVHIMAIQNFYIDLITIFASLLIFITSVGVFLIRRQFTRMSYENITLERNILYSSMIVLVNAVLISGYYVYDLMQLQ